MNHTCRKCGLPKTSILGRLHGKPKTTYKCRPCEKVYRHSRYLLKWKPIKQALLSEKRTKKLQTAPPEGFRDCKKCGERKSIELFPKTKKWPRHECKACTNTYKVSYSKPYRQRPEVKEKWKAYNKEYKPEWRKRIDIRLHRNVTKTIKDCLDGKRRSQEIFIRLGWNVQDLIIHLESLFSDGMSWENYGEWHIDHIMPRSMTPYVSLDDENFAKCWKLSNLQPLWALDNMRKGNKIL